MNGSLIKYLRKCCSYRLFFKIMLIAIIGLAGCSNKSKQKQVESIPIHITLVAGDNINLNEDGVANPVRVQIYQLHQQDLFDAADFLTLSEKGDPQLAEQSQTILDTIIRPGEKKERDIIVKGDVMALAAVIAYRDISHSAWKQVVAMPARPEPRWYQNLYLWPEKAWRPHFVIHVGRLATTVKSME